MRLDACDPKWPACSFPAPAPFCCYRTSGEVARGLDVESEMAGEITAEKERTTAREERYHGRMREAQEEEMEEG